MNFLRVDDVTKKVAIKKSEIWKRVKAGRFPQPISLSRRVTVWDCDEVEDWMIAQKKLSRKGEFAVGIIP